MEFRRVLFRSPIPIHPLGAPSQPRSIQDKLLIAISESRRALPKSARHPGNAGLRFVHPLHASSTSPRVYGAFEVCCVSLAFDLPASPRILVITMRRLGDVLLTTPLVHALRRGYADARIDMLVFAGTEGILAGNGDIDRIIVLPQRPSGAETRALVRSLWRRYDLAVSTQAGDRPTFLAFAAGRCRIGLVPCDGGGLWWKRRALDRAVPSDPRLHRVTELLRLADALGIERRHEKIGRAHV